jgi:hypothetical protein
MLGSKRSTEAQSRRWGDRPATVVQLGLRLAAAESEALAEQEGQRDRSPVRVGQVAARRALGVQRELQRLVVRAELLAVAAVQGRQGQAEQPDPRATQAMLTQDWTQVSTRRPATRMKCRVRGCL